MKELIRKSKGITLVALVITIIILLILAGISISELSGQGLFAKAIAAKENNKIAELEEKLKTELYACIASNQGLVDVNTYINYLKSEEVIDESDVEEEIKDITYNVTMDGEYIFLVEEQEKNKINIEYNGKTGKILPKIKGIQVLEKTTNSIKVEVSTKYSEGATYKYYIKGQDEEYGKEKAEIKGNIYEFTGLIQDKKYTVKVRVTTSNGSVEKETEVYLGAIKEVELGSFSPATWTNGNVTVTLPIEEGYTTRYTIDGTVPTTSSTQYTAPFTVSSNKIIMYCYSDGTNVSNYGVLEVNNIDKVDPTVGTGLNNTEKTTNSMTMNFKVIDENSGISKIIWYYKLETETQFISESEINENAPINGDKIGITTEQNKTKTFSDLINGTYNVYAEVYDVAGNITRTPTSGTVDVELNAVLQANGATISPSTYTNGNVTVTLPTAPSGFTTRYTTDGNIPTTSSTQYTAPFTVSSNQTINYCYSDGINVGQYGTQEVNNIDKTKPIVTVATATTNSIAITATDEKSGIVGYAVTTSNTEPSASSYTAVTSTTSLSTTVTGKTQNTTYYVWVKDQAGNVSESKSTSTGTVTSGTTTGAITFGTTTWSGGKASTTISTNTSYTIQYQVNSITGTWTTGTSVTGLAHGDNVYARLWDGTNAGTASAAYNILDGTNPSARISLSAQNVYTTGSITATVTHTDNESGVNIANCKWVYNTTSSKIGTTANSYTGGTFSSASQTITLSATTAGTYYLHVLTTDVAGRKVETISNAVTVTVDPLLIPTIPATTIAEAQSQYMLTKTVNSPIVDAYGNKITVPAGFRIKADSTTNYATTVDKGIVIIDSNENEFVWIPVGTIYTNVNKTASKTIDLGRYVFKEDGTIDTTLSQTKPEGKLKTGSSEFYYYTEGKASDTTRNTHAKDIETFKTKASATQSGGFYIGRYEARTATARSESGNVLTTLTTKSSDYVYNYVTQLQAANLARNMYQNATTFTSDLMNGYAWDTATLFLQTCGNNPTPYSRQNRVTSSYASTGTNNQTTKDVQCNVYDMASNVLEWTTESYSNSVCPFVSRGSSYNYSNFYTNLRANQFPSGSYDDCAFRPIIYL